MIWVADVLGLMFANDRKGRPGISSSKIFVGNLSLETGQDALKSLMSEVGAIQDVYLPTDRATGQPRGFAFVEFADSTAAAAAIEKFDGYELGGRSLRVNMAEERKPRSPRPAPYRSDDSFGGSDARSGGGDRPSKPKGSRRGARGRKRSL